MPWQLQNKTTCLFVAVIHRRRTWFWEGEAPAEPNAWGVVAISESLVGNPRICSLLFCTLVLLTVAFPVSASAQSAASSDDGWPFVRGPGFDGHSVEKDIADQWPKEGPPVLWQRNLGQGYSAFVAQADRVYTQAQNMTGQYIYCLNADTGETIWEYRYDWPYESAGVYPGPRSTPTLSGGRVYFTSPDGLLGCLDQPTGQELWSVDLLNVYGIEGCDFGYACSPTVVDGLVIMPVGGKGAGVVAFDSVTGKEVWKSTSDPASYSPAFPIKVGDTPLVVCYMQNSLLVLHRASGELFHREKLSNGYDEHSAWPIYSEPFLWLSAPFKSGSWLLDLSAEEPTVVWRSKTLSNDVCSSICVDGNIYGFDIFDIQSKTHRPSRGIFRCIEFETGTELWANGNGRPRRTSNADEFKSDIGQCGMVYADGKLVVLNELGELILLKVDPQQCTELARCTVLGGELTWTPPCLHQGRVYVRNQSTAVCVYVGLPGDLGAEVLLRAGEQSQRTYYNLAAMILAVEPEYAFDVPHDRWLVQWFLACMAVLVLGKLTAALWRRDSDQPENGLLTATSIEFLVIVLAGAIGTTLLGTITGEFIFTWPVCLYAALEFVARPETASVAGDSAASRFLRRRVPLFAFLAISAAYFLICRRLSLVFEWAFLVGFVGALPVVWFAHRAGRFSPVRFASRLSVSLLGFVCFYGSAVAFLKSRY